MCCVRVWLSVDSCPHFDAGRRQNPRGRCSNRKEHSERKKKLSRHCTYVKPAASCWTFCKFCILGKDELEGLRQEASKAESKLRKKAEEDILRKEQAHQAGKRCVSLRLERALPSCLEAALHAEREKLFQDRYKLRTRFMGEQLVLEARKLKDELIRHKRIRLGCYVSTRPGQ